MTKPLYDVTVAILVAKGFEQSELEVPRQALEAAGAAVHIISPEALAVRSWRNDDWGARLAVDVPLARARPQDYDALVLPGGPMSADALRTDERALDFIGAFVDAEKLVAAIGHGPLPLINADAVRDRRITSIASIRVDLENAGASWRDAPVVVDQLLVTSRTARDLDAFCAALIENLTEPDAMEHGHLVEHHGNASSAASSALECKTV